jgi:hypothetical protein
MFELITGDHDLYCYYHDTRLFLLCPDGEQLQVVSDPAYCREGFSVIVSQAAWRTHRLAVDVHKYGHRLSYVPPSLVNKKGKLDVLRDGRLYFGMLIGTRLGKSLAEGWDRYPGCENIRGAGVEITELEELADNNRKVYVVSAPARFATNTWTTSLLTGLARSVVLGGRNELHLDLPVVDFLFEYVNEVEPSKYKNLRSYQWSSSFGVYELWRQAREVAISSRGFVGDIDTMLRRVLYHSTVSSRAEVISLLKYAKAKGRNDLINTTNIPL